ncbi:hypothetical protein [Pontibacillus litoralis]|uniref:YneQ n=1 Tax=Pontibacillus litoralis JSM 072002 TaxID=1385512 RepID=A0A0A5G371_9BACI|nr:hypothetical protein [Pontibacillus litoralis]KGX87551.1 hypothetical protein N784_14995 [Pontibacillus litoralis JSM 072002]
MAFGVKRFELNQWKKEVQVGKIAFLTHYWLDDRFPDDNTVTKVGCGNIDLLMNWGKKYGLKKEWIHYSSYPHFDLFGNKQLEILLAEKQYEQIERFHLQE